jgi:hypothetical protein
LCVTLAARFLPAFLVTLDNFAERDYFAKAAPDRCSDGNSYSGPLLEGLSPPSGKIRSLGSPVMAPRLADPLPFVGDEHLRGLVTRALAAFSSAEAGQRWTGLRDLADAYERIKSAQVPGNERRSVAAVVSALRPEAALGQHLDGLLREMTTLSNDF